MIKWEGKYATGVEKIDRQHQWIFNFTNDLESQLKCKNRKVDVRYVLDSLGTYAQMHFQYEEGCMGEWKCPLAGKNKCAHDNFLFAYKNFMERYNREGHSDDLAWKIHDMVEKWIVSHICLIDIHLRDFAKVH